MSNSNADTYSSRNVSGWIHSTQLKAIEPIWLATNQSIPAGLFSSFGLHAYCDWDGVGCDDDGYIVSLDLQRRGLEGSIPSDIRGLSRLRRLRADFNFLTSTLPTELGELSHLLHLNLGHNSIGGSLPDLSNHLLLRRLVLESNRFSGSIPSSVCRLNQLEMLKLSSNPLVYGTLPTCLGDLMLLTTLRLKDTSLTGSIPAGLCTGFEFGCDSIGCPAGWYLEDSGRQSHSAEPCLPCHSPSNVLASTTCRSTNLANTTTSVPSLQPSLELSRTPALSSEPRNTSKPFYPEQSHAPSKIPSPLPTLSKTSDDSAQPSRLLSEFPSSAPISSPSMVPSTPPSTLLVLKSHSPSLLSLDFSLPSLQPSSSPFSSVSGLQTREDKAQVTVGDRIAIGATAALCIVLSIVLVCIWRVQMPSKLFPTKNAARAGVSHSFDYENENSDDNSQELSEPGGPDFRPLDVESASMSEHTDVFSGIVEDETRPMPHVPSSSSRIESSSTRASSFSRIQSETTRAASSVGSPVGLLERRVRFDVPPGRSKKSDSSSGSASLSVSEVLNESSDASPTNDSFASWIMNPLSRDSFERYMPVLPTLCQGPKPIPDDVPLIPPGSPSSSLSETEQKEVEQQSPHEFHQKDSSQAQARVRLRKSASLVDSEEGNEEERPDATTHTLVEI